MNLGLGGLTVLITGAASGIGRATAAVMAGEGARVIGVDRDKDGLADVIGGLAAPHAAITADLATEDGVIAATHEALSVADSAIDIVISNAGQCKWRTFSELTGQDWLDTLSINLMPTIHMMRILLPVMLGRRTGSVVVVSSDLARQPEAGPPDYQVAKTGLLSVTKSLAIEGAPHVRVNAVAPGLVASPMTFAPGGLADRLAERYGVPPEEAVPQELGRRGQLLARPATPREIASLITFMASGANSYMTGSVVTADGGSNRGLY